eukprot:gb/GECG01015745.1/.p1 GENE.gb/GECG01015745.1/~~gb/GECG01015745.1/.p1  ORF type:complete len:416 (+),score=33.29 gb/GECG01015745.1/:1-1248(+)
MLILCYVFRLCRFLWQTWKVNREIAHSLSEGVNLLEGETPVFDRILDLVGAVDAAASQHDESTFVEVTVKLNLKIFSRARVTVLMPPTTLTLTGLEDKLQVRTRGRLVALLLSIVGPQHNSEISRILGKVSIGGLTSKLPIEVSWMKEKHLWAGDVPLTLNIHIKKAALSTIVGTAKHSMAGASGGIRRIKLNALLDTLSLFRNYKLWFLLQEFCIPIAQTVFDTHELRQEKETGPGLGNLLSQSQRLFSFQKVVISVIQSWLNYAESIDGPVVTPWKPWKGRFDAFNHSLKKCARLDRIAPDFYYLDWRGITSVGSLLISLIRQTRQSHVTDPQFLRLFKLMALVVESLLCVKVLLASQEYASRQAQEDTRNAFWAVVKNVMDVTAHLLREDISVLCRMTQSLWDLKQVEVVKE